MKDMITIERAIVLDGSFSARTFHWNVKDLISTQETMKKFLRKKYGESAISDHFTLTIYSYYMDHEKVKFITITENGILEENWLIPLRNKTNSPLLKENGNFLDGTLIFCDTTWKKMETKDFQLLNELFLKAKEEEKVIFVPYSNGKFHLLQQFFLEQKDAKCKLVKFYSFDTSKLESLNYPLLKAKPLSFTPDLLTLDQEKKKVLKKTETY